MFVVSNDFCYLFVKFRDICIYCPFCTLKLSLDDYENLVFKPCDLYFVSINIHFLFHIDHNWNCDGTELTNNVTFELEGRYSLETLHFDFDDKINLWDLSFASLFTSLTEEGRYLNLLQLHHDIRVQRGLLLPSATAHNLTPCPSI